MRQARRWLLLGGVTALVLSLIVAVVVARGSARAHRTVYVSQDDALAVVLVPGLATSELVVVDLGNQRVARRVSLRSLVTDIDVDTSSGVIAAAQSGGVGTAADDAVSLTDPRSGDVRYVTLPRRDPGSVACASGLVHVLHAIIESKGMVESTVDVAKAAVVATGHAPDGTGVWTAACGSLWTVVPKGEKRGMSLVRVDPSALSTQTVPTPGLIPVAVEEASGSVAVLGEPSGVGEARVALVQPGTGAQIATSSAPGLDRAATIGAVVGRSFVVGDWNGEEPENRTLAVLDLGTLRSRGTISIDGVPCAVAGWQGRLLVVDRLGGRLLEIDPANGEVLARVDLGARDLIYSEVVVVPQGVRGRKIPTAQVADGGFSGR